MWIINLNNQYYNGAFQFGNITSAICFEDYAHAAYIAQLYGAAVSFFTG